MYDLTKDAYRVLCLMYDLFQKNVKSGMSKTKSKEFEESFYRDEKRLAKWHKDDIEAALQELINKHYLKTDIIGDYTLTDQAIITMENKFKDNASEILEILSNFVP